MSTCESQPAAGGRWENDIAQVHARVHNDHTFIGHRYVDDAPGLGPAQLDFLETLSFDHMESRIANIGTALKDTCCWFFETPGNILDGVTGAGTIIITGFSGSRARLHLTSRL
jgi:hypothetical protein